MGHQDNISRAVAFIEANLHRNIRAHDVAKAAAYSLFHFHRIFLAATGTPLKTYVRKRKLTEAARALIGSDAGIIDIALNAGFGSQETFTRAFKKMFGMPPGRFRTQGRHAPSKYKNPFLFNLTAHKGDVMTPEIKEKKGFKIVGLRHFGTNEGDVIPGLWDRFFERAHEIGNLGNPVHYYGLCTVPENSPDTPDGNIPFEYVAGRDVTAFDKVPKGMVAREVPGARYAVFTHRGSLENLKATYGYIYGEWLRRSGCKMISGNYDFEFYSERFDPSGSEASELYIYLPVK